MSHCEFSLECVSYVIQTRFFPLFHINFDHVEAPWQIASAELLEPSICAAFDEDFFRLIHGIQRSDFSAFLSRFDFHKKQKFSIPRDDIHLTFSGTPKIPREDPVAFGAQVIHRYPLAIIAEPRAATPRAVRCPQTARCIERPAETSDDDGDKGRDSEALQDELWCHILGVSQSRIEGIRGRFPPSVDHE